MLLSNMQRTKIESKSQPIGQEKFKKEGCYQICKELKLKANHNSTAALLLNLAVVIKYAKN